MEYESKGTPLDLKGNKYRPNKKKYFLIQHTVKLQNFWLGGYLIKSSTQIELGNFMTTNNIFSVKSEYGKGKSTLIPQV